MNRDIGRGTDSLQHASSSNYLIYLFVVSASFVVLLPYLIPLSRTVLPLGKKVDVVEKVTSETLKKSSPSTYTSSTSTYASISTDVMVPRGHLSDSKREALEVLIVDLQKMVLIERERTLRLENEIQILHISERFLKERLQKLEDRSPEYRRDFSASSIHNELLMQNMAATQSKQENLDILVHELLRMLQSEKERTSALALEVGMLRKSETILFDRIKRLEEKLNLFLTNYRQTNVFDSKYEQHDSNKN